MNLLKAALYDPAGAVSKSTASLIAMTAFDTTNLRLAITVPAHGMVRFKLHCVLEGATTFPSVLLGVLNGATVIGRVSPTQTLGNTAVATARLACDAEFTVTGLAAGAMNVDAAYGVEVVVAATNIKYGGPNDTTTDNAWGAFVFEAWDPQPLGTAGLSVDASGRVDVGKWLGTAVTAATAGIPDTNTKNINNVAAATPGAANGILISGSNAGTTTLGALTITGATTHTGNVVLSDGLTISAPSTLNRAGLDIAGNGTGAAIKGVAGATGVGLSIAGGGTSGDGVKVTTTSGHGVNLAPVGTNMHGLLSTGGNGGVSDGVKAAAGTGGVDLRAAITGNVTGNLSGSAGSVTGAVGSVTAAVTVGTINANVITAGSINAAALNGKGDWATVNPTNLTAAQIATGVWQDTTAGDFTVALSVGKSVMNGVALGTGLTIASVSGAVGSVTAAVTLPSIPANWITAAGINAAALNGKGDWLTSGGYTAPDNANIAAIKVQTDKLVFTVANKLDVNVLKINGVTIVGDGSATPFNV